VSSEKRREYYQNTKKKKLLEYLNYKDKDKEWAEKYKNDNIIPKNKDSQLRHNFGITLDDYNKILEKQDHKCAICHISLEEFTSQHKKFNYFVVDHNHTTGKIRGLLCSNCNTALGMLNDNINNLYMAINYLQFSEVI